MEVIALAVNDCSDDISKCLHYINKYIHICTFVHIHIRIYIHTYIYVYTFIHTYIHTYIRINIHTYIYIHTYILIYKELNKTQRDLIDRQEYLERRILSNSNNLRDLTVDL